MIRVELHNTFNEEIEIYTKTHSSICLFAKERRDVIFTNKRFKEFIESEKTKTVSYRIIK